MMTFRRVPLPPDVGDHALPRPGSRPAPPIGSRPGHGRAVCLRSHATLSKLTRRNWFTTPTKWQGNMARRSIRVTTAIAAALVFGLTACGGDSGGDSGGSGSSGSRGGEAQGKVGVILPDTESSVPRESFDRPYLEAAFKEAGVDYDIQNAEGDADRMTTIAEQMITEGATVLAIVNLAPASAIATLDSASGAQIEEAAAQEGVKTIDYDRLTLGGQAEAYVSFDNTEV